MVSRGAIDIGTQIGILFSDLISKISMIELFTYEELASIFVILVKYIIYSILYSTIYYIFFLLG